MSWASAFYVGSNIDSSVEQDAVEVTRTEGLGNLASRVDSHSVELVDRSIKLIARSVELGTWGGNLRTR